MQCFVGELFGMYIVYSIYYILYTISSSFYFLFDKIITHCNTSQTKKNPAENRENNRRDFTRLLRYVGGRR